MRFPLQPWYGAFGRDWLTCMWESYDDLCFAWEKLPLPKYLEGDDIFQSLVERWWDEGFPENEIEDWARYFMTSGVNLVLDLIRKETGRSVDSTGAFRPRLFIGVDQTEALMDCRGRVWSLDHEAEVGQELAVMLAAVSEEDRGTVPSGGIG